MTWCVEALFALVSVQAVVGIRVDNRVEAVTIFAALTIRIVGQREQIFAPDLSFGEERYTTLIKVAVFIAGISRGNRVVR